MFINGEQKSGGDNELSKTICPTNQPLPVVYKQFSFMDIFVKKRTGKLCGLFVGGARTGQDQDS